MEPNTIHCPKCQSTQLHFAKKGFSGKKAVVGGILTGGLGLFAGTIGSNKILANCMSCGNKFSPSELKRHTDVTSNSTHQFLANVPNKPVTRTKKLVVMFFFYAITLCLVSVFISSMIESGFSILLFLLLLLISFTYLIAHEGYKSLSK